MANRLPIYGQLLTLPPKRIFPRLASNSSTTSRSAEGKVYNRFLIHPEWPGAASGVTIGVGYDLGYNSAAVIRQDWAASDDVNQLATAAGITGSRARAILSAYRAISIQWDDADAVSPRRYPRKILCAHCASLSRSARASSERTSGPSVSRVQPWVEPCWLKSREMRSIQPLVTKRLCRDCFRDPRNGKDLARN